MYIHIKLTESSTLQVRAVRLPGCIRRRIVKEEDVLRDAHSVFSATAVVSVPKNAAF